MSFLAIKLQVLRLDQPQKNQQLLTETIIIRVLSFYYPYISALADQYYGRLSLDIGKIKMFNFVGEYSHSAKLRHKLWAGGQLSDAAFSSALL